MPSHARSTEKKETLWTCFGGGAARVAQPTTAHSRLSIPRAFEQHPKFVQPSLAARKIPPAAVTSAYHQCLFQFSSKRAHQVGNALKYTHSRRALRNAKRNTGRKNNVLLRTTSTNTARENDLLREIFRTESSWPRHSKGISLGKTIIARVALLQFGLERQEQHPCQ